MAINGINAGVPSTVYESNMQHVGGTSQSVNKKDLEPAKQEDSAKVYDQVSLSGQDIDEAGDAFKNASHVGAFGASAKEDDAVEDDKGDFQYPAVVDNSFQAPATVDDSFQPPAVVDDSFQPPAVIDDSFQPPAVIDDGKEPGGPGGPAGPGGPGGPAGPDDPEDPKGPKGPDDDGKSIDERMADWRKAQEEQEIWDKFMIEMAAQHQKWMEELLKIIQDTQAAIMEIIQSVAVNQARVSDHCCRAWDDVIRGR